MKKSILLAFVWALFGTAFFVGGEAQAFAGDPRCACDPLDRFDPQPVVPAGPFKNACLVCEKRSVNRLNKSEAQDYAIPAAGDLWIANLRHGDRYYVARVQPTQIKEVIIQIENFKAVVPAAHSQIRFKFNPGFEVELFDQVTRQTAGKLSDIVASGEAVLPKHPGAKFDLIRGGTEQHFGFAYTFVSLANKVKSQVIDQNNKVEQWRLSLSQTNRVRILNAAVDLGERMGMDAYYDLIQRSCTTELYRAIDQAIDYTYTAVQRRAMSTPVPLAFVKSAFPGPEHAHLVSRIPSSVPLIDFLNRVPMLAEMGLSQRGLLASDGSEKLPLLNEEFAQR